MFMLNSYFICDDLLDLNAHKRVRETSFHDKLAGLLTLISIWI